MSGESEATVGISNMAAMPEPAKLVTSTLPVDSEPAGETPFQSPIEYNAPDDYHTQATDHVLTLWFNRNSLELTELLSESDSEAIDELGLL
jgi:hypothetical protein